MCKSTKRNGGKIGMRQVRLKVEREKLREGPESHGGTRAYAELRSICSGSAMSKVDIRSTAHLILRTCAAARDSDAAVAQPGSRRGTRTGSSC